MCVTEMEDLKITLFGGSTGDDESTLRSCVYTLPPLIFCPLSIHLRPSSLQSICHPRPLCDDSPRSFLPLLSLWNVIFHFGRVYMVSGHSAPFHSLFLFFYFMLLLLSSLPLCSFTSSSSSSLTLLTIISPDKTSLSCRCAEKRKTKWAEG